MTAAPGRPRNIRSQDLQAGVAHGVRRAAEPPAVAQFGPQRHRDPRHYPVGAAGKARQAGWRRQRSAPTVVAEATWWGCSGLYPMTPPAQRAPLPSTGASLRGSTDPAAGEQTAGGGVSSMQRCSARVSPARNRARPRFLPPISHCAFCSWLSWRRAALSRLAPCLSSSPVDGAGLTAQRSLLDSSPVKRSFISWRLSAFRHSHSPATRATRR